MIHFISIDDALYFHDEEIKAAGGAEGIRDMPALESALGAPQASFDGNHLMDIFEMAATYANSISMNHPFVDGNKRTAAVCAVTFLYINGFTLDERHDEELADIILALINKNISKEELARYFKEQSTLIYGE